MTRALADLADEVLLHNLSFLGLAAQPARRGSELGTQVKLKRGCAVVRIK